MDSKRRLVVYLFRVLSRFTKVVDDQIAIVFRGYSGSNLTPIIERLREDRRYKVRVLRDDKSDFGSTFVTFKHLFLKYWTVFRSRVVITTHGFYRLHPNSTMINLWHVVPIKGMGLMNSKRKGGRTLTRI